MGAWAIPGGLGRKTFETNANWELTQFQYDPSGNLTNLIDGKGASTKWNYDQYGRVTNKVDNSGNVLFTYGYDADDRLVGRTNATSVWTSYFYDKDGNLTNVVYAHNTDITNSFDALDRLTNMVDAVGTTMYSYDAAGQLLSEDGPWSDDTVSFTYQNRLRTSLSLLAPDASPWTESYGYDSARRLTSLSSPAGSFGYTYNLTRHEQVAKLALPSGAYILNTYDTLARLLSTTLKNSGNTALNSHKYGYNMASERTALTNFSGDYWLYTYDKIGQLQTAAGSEANGNARLQEELGYTYDLAHNLNYRTNNALLQTFNVNSLNELATLDRTGTFTVAGTTTSPATNVTVNGSAATLYGDDTFAEAGFTLANGNNTFTAIAQDQYGRSDTNSTTCYLPATNSYSYDLNGNLTGDGNRYFGYDDENQLVSVWVTNAWRSDFVYDGKMRRRIRREYTWSGSAWVQTNEVHYIYDRNLVIEERDANNLPLVAYTRGRDLSGSIQGAGGIGGLLARTDYRLLTARDRRATAYYHADGNGNITALINTNQTIAAKYLYDPYGNILSQSGPLADANLYRFSSKEFHINSGTIYYLYRYYDPMLQRWPNRDPLGEPGFEVVRKNGNHRLSQHFKALGANLYRFVGNSPTGEIDPLGLMMSKADCGALLRKAAKLVEQAEQEPWNSLALNAEAERLLSIWARFCEPPPSPPLVPEPEPDPFPINVPPYKPPFCQNYGPILTPPQQVATGIGIGGILIIIFTPWPGNPIYAGF